ncbi:nuclear transport factor 2 family protein [Streptomyces sp. NBC_00631]|uniref:nuclear transport factor 2 family protein n=1 Tax=Streptomyces sp. NBC_00631 TaxID=2975793 RepID=UPI0030E4BE36
MPTADATAPTGLREAHRACLDAEIEGDTTTLEGLLAEDFTLTHVTGYVQPKAEWLAQMRQGRFVYHSIEEKDTAFDVDDDGTARLTARTLADATVYGTRADWRLGLATVYACHDDAWVATDRRRHLVIRAAGLVGA